MTDSARLVAQWVRPDIQALSAYAVADATGLVKLDAMENPYPLPEAIKGAWLQTLASVELNRYPHPAAPAVQAGLRRMMGLDDRHGLILGNGSDELIQIMAMALARPGATLMSIEPAFVMYRMIATFMGMRYAGVPLDDEFGIDMPAMRVALREHAPALIFLAQPNNPTGNVFDAAAVEEIIRLAPGLVVIDEAYMAFTDANALPLLDRYPNVVVMRTLSKVGLAGLRLGFLAGDRAWTDAFDKVRLPYNINVLTQASAAFALEHYEVLQDQTRRLREARAMLMQSLVGLPLVRIYPSEANFILVRTVAGRARATFESMKQQGVLVKCLDGAHPLLADCLRLTVGSPGENTRMVETLKNALV